MRQDPFLEAFQKNSVLSFGVYVCIWRRDGTLPVFTNIRTMPERLSLSFRLDTQLFYNFVGHLTTWLESIYFFSHLYYVGGESRKEKLFFGLFRVNHLSRRAGCKLNYHPSRPPPNEISIRKRWTVDRTLDTGHIYKFPNIEKIATVKYIIYLIRCVNKSRDYKECLEIFLNKSKASFHRRKKIFAIASRELGDDNFSRSWRWWRKVKNRSIGNRLNVFYFYPV